jgi:hypothetical protein
MKKELSRISHKKFTKNSRAYQHKSSFSAMKIIENFILVFFLKSGKIQQKEKKEEVNANQFNRSQN